ncbi:MAG TPA: serine protease [Marinagarivorans sp.]
MLPLKKRVMRTVCVIAVLLGCASHWARASTDAVGVYAAYQNSIFQVRIIEVASGSRASLGTGFVVADGSMLATNYHVIASKIFKPDKYRIEIEKAGQTQTLKVLAVDVVHDLALLAVDNPASVSLKEGAPVADLALANPDASDVRATTVPATTPSGKERLGEAFLLETALPAKGETLYSLGNPHDIGMTVVEGNFNGLVERRFIEQIHFSGAINPGMSGGPVVNNRSAVVGVNVATSGNQIGFLVPVKALSQLIQRYQLEGKVSDLIPVITRQIAAHTGAMVETALATPWQTTLLGSVEVATSPLPWLECWGDSDRDKKKKTFTVARGCHSGHSLYVAHGFNTGYVEYEYLYFSADGWPSYSVYRHLADETRFAVPANRGPEDQLTGYRCLDKEVVNARGLEARVSYCLREYKKLAGLHDAFYMAVSVDRDREGVMSHYTLSGVTEATAQKFLHHFAQVLAWPSS